MANFFGLDKFKEALRIVKFNGGLKGCTVKMLREDDLKIGKLVGVDKSGNKYYENDSYFVEESVRAASIIEEKTSFVKLYSFQFSSEDLWSSTDSIHYVIFAFGGRNRWVEFSGKYGYDYDGSCVSPEWFGWLHYKTDLLPSQDKSRPSHKWMSEHTENFTGTNKEYVPYSTTKSKVQPWIPSNFKK